MSDEEEEVAAELAQLAAGGGESPAPTESPDEDDGDEEGDEEAVSIQEMLLETEPDLKPTQVAEDQGIETYQAHGYVGARKMLAAAGFDLGGKKGTPAIVNVGHFIRGSLEGRGDDQEDDDDGETHPETPDVAQEFA